MKQFGKRALSVLLALVMMLGILPAILTPLTVSAANSAPVITGASGIWRYFKEDTYYDMSAKVNMPMTYEFEIVGCGGFSSSAKGGVILGNYSEDAAYYVNVEVDEWGRIYVRGKFGANKSEWKAQFESGEADVRVNALHRYTITIGSGWAGVSLYVDGVKKATRYPVSVTIPKASDFSHPFRIGGDYRSGNTAHFQGAINSVALYSDVRTDAEIKADTSATKTWGAGNDGLIAAYDITMQGEKALRDWSGNGNTLVYTNGSGMQVENFGSYNIEKKLEAVPETVEAWVYLPLFYNERGGTFFGNSGTGDPSLGFEIEYSGHPRFFYTTASGSAAYHEFGKVDMTTGEWQHLTVVHDAANGEARCYINGALAETLAYTEHKDNDNGGKQDPVAPYSSKITEQYFIFGGDRQSGYAQYFKGFIKEFRAYSDVRSAEEIAQDYAGTLDKSDEDLLLCYQLSQENAYKNIEDLSGNGYTAVYDQLLWDYKDTLKDYAYSFAVVGDTQNITNSNPDQLKTIYEWILDNQSAKNIQYVIGLGDITELGEDEGHRNYDYDKATAQWTAAREAISLMDGKIPYSLIRGAGHDGVEFFNEYFGSHEGYTSQIDGYYQEGRIENTYHTFKVGKVDYMILCLDFGAKDDVLAWANEVVAAHPAHRVIVTTHAYMQKDGSFLEGGEDYAPSQDYYDVTNNDGDDIWNKFVRKHANICMVMCGHLSVTDVIVGEQTGDYGNKVTQLLIDPSMMDSSTSPKGMVAMLYFSADGEDVQVEYYSTITDTQRPNKSFTVSYGSTEAPDYDTIPEGYVVAQNNETKLYTVIENKYFQFLGGSLRYSDHAKGYANIRFGYQFSASFDLAVSNWQWNYGVEGEGRANYIKGENKTANNVTNLVITGVPESYYQTNLESRLSFEVKIDGVTYTVADRVRSRNVFAIAQGMVRNPNESDDAKVYAQAIINACS